MRNAGLLLVLPFQGPRCQDIGGLLSARQVALDWLETLANLGHGRGTGKRVDTYPTDKCLGSNEPLAQ